MSVEEDNKARQRRALEEVFAKQNLEIIPELFHPYWVEHRPEGDLKYGEGTKNTDKFHIAFPDLQVTIDDMIAEGDKTVTRVTMSGTFTGEFHGIAPTGKTAAIPGIVISHFAGGKEVEAWGSYDSLSMYQQLGVTPPTQ